MSNAPPAAPSRDALASPWNLCFLSGPMYGRTMSLARGANWVGTAADCEVILPDREIAAKQVCLQVGALAVTVQNFGESSAPVLFNDEPLGTGRRSLTPADVVTVGSIRLGIARNALSAVAVPAESDQPQTGRDAAWLGWLADAGRRVGSRRFVIVLAALWIGVALGALGYGLVAWSGGLPWQHESTLSRVHRLQQALRAYPELEVAPREDGALVTGYVKDAAEREKVAQIVASVDNAALGNIYVVSDLLATAQTYFSDTPLNVSYEGRGRIELTGSAPRAQIAQRIQNYMKDARPALEVVDRVRYDDPHPPMRAGMLGGTAGIPEIVTVFAGDGDQRYIETVDGSRYFEGARMKQGPTVVSIGPDEVVFDVDGRRVTMPLGGKTAGTPAGASAAEPASAVTGGAAAGVAMPVSGTAASSVAGTAPEAPPTAQPRTRALPP
ncbi:type III secretion system inner membrane ring subunit SctD [Paraburkholderia sp. Tr-20389]|uniref:type III secretion system inner membrane ring subunit SctD n=1 Tax=Paraburkholderia sp. Tr-20389 TaxID=2703903 RepID=UPI001F11C255|nr:type III secretion system inner membrane ring subunit SctD [Paraburkholderia sp. Tr-20389]